MGIHILDDTCIVKKYRDRIREKQYSKTICPIMPVAYMLFHFFLFDFLEFWFELFSLVELVGADLDEDEGRDEEQKNDDGIAWVKKEPPGF